LARDSALAVSLEAAVLAEGVPSPVAGAASFEASKPEDRLARLSLFTVDIPLPWHVQHLSSVMSQYCCASFAQIMGEMRTPIQDFCRGF
jgi:hypothetical protein